MPSGVFDGDLVRPLGRVTLHCGYAEAEIDELLRTLQPFDSASPPTQTTPVGEKVARALRSLHGLQSNHLDGLIEILDEAEALFRRRNELVHGQLFAGGRLQSLKGQRFVTVEQLDNLAEAIFSWKERLSAQRQRILPLVLASRAKTRGA